MSQLRNPDGFTIDSLIVALYESMSFLPGDEPDWERFANLFSETAIIIPSSSNKDENPDSLTVDDFVASASASLAESGQLRKGFFEEEISRRIECFGNIGSVWSTFEDRIGPGEDSLGRGINCIQVIKYRDRWWIASMIWDKEDEDQDKMIPSRYMTA
eukprot:TRINITY_DN847_c0_g1_i1.p2 TRINITY_DN847_c0_g1~~TRINITY_DN847_c0_g1_i1.p2  ORF type:complete len:158 (+),score=29.84 TRINITY_DN847_c0_g1_i1:976-1449(+)